MSVVQSSTHLIKRVRRKAQHVAGSLRSDAGPTDSAQESAPRPKQRYQAPTANRTGDAGDNVEWNKERWGQSAGWEQHDGFGYRWGGGFQHTTSSVAQFFDNTFGPHTSGRYDLDILEISPGAGRSTAEILRYAQHLSVVDLNEAAIDICRDRFQYFPDAVEYYVNDGQSLECVAHREFDVVASFDSLVHVHPDIVRGYLQQAAELLRAGGIVWFDTSGKGERSHGHRSGVTAELMAEWAEEFGLEMVEQNFRNEWDCITVLRKPS